MVDIMQLYTECPAEHVQHMNIASVFEKLYKEVLELESEEQGAVNIRFDKLLALQARSN